ncbi:MAG: hypothetical protein QXW79_01000 [Thermoplasmata archaeon]
MAATSVINPNVNLEKILGQQFKELITLLESPDPWKFFKNKEVDPGKKSRPPGSSDEDIHPSLFQRLMASTVAFREIEHPKTEKIESSVKIAEIIGNIMDNLINDTNNVHRYHVDNYLFKYSSNYLMSIGHLIPGFNLFPSDSAAYQPEFNADNPGTPLINTIKFLYFYIALLDSFTFRTGRDVVVFLMENDNIYFNSYVNKLVEHIMTYLDKQSIDESVVRYGVYEALKDVADVISSDLSKDSPDLTVLDTRNVIERINNFDNFYKSDKDVDFRSIIDNILGFSPKNLVEDLVTKLKLIVNVHNNNTSEKIRQLYYGDQTEQKNTLLSSLYNIEYLNPEKVNEELTRTTYKAGVDPLASSGKYIGNDKKVDSARFLYATYITEGQKPKLVTHNQYDVEGNDVLDSNLVNYNHVKNICEIIRILPLEDFGKSNNNLSRAAFLGLIFYFVANNLDMSSVNDYDDHLDDIKKYMINFVNKYKELRNRLHIVKEKLGIQNGVSTKIGSDKVIINTFVNGFALSIGEIYKVLPDGSLMLKAPLSTVVPPTTTAFQTHSKKHEQDVRKLISLMEETESTRILVQLQTQEDCIKKMKEQFDLLALQLDRYLQYAKNVELASVIAKKMGKDVAKKIIEEVNEAADMENLKKNNASMPNATPYMQELRLTSSQLKNIERIVFLLTNNNYLLPLDQLKKQLKRIINFITQASNIQTEITRQLSTENVLTDLQINAPNILRELDNIKKDVDKLISSDLKTLTPLENLNGQLNKVIKSDFMNVSPALINDMNNLIEQIRNSKTVLTTNNFNNLVGLLTGDNIGKILNENIDHIANLQTLQNADWQNIITTGKELLDLAFKTSNILYEQHKQQMIVLEWQLKKLTKKKPKIIQLKQLLDKIYSIQERNSKFIKNEMDEMNNLISAYTKDLRKCILFTKEIAKDEYLVKDLLNDHLSVQDKVVKIAGALAFTIYNSKDSSNRDFKLYLDPSAAVAAAAVPGAAGTFKNLLEGIEELKKLCSGMIEDVKKIVDERNNYVKGAPGRGGHAPPGVTVDDNLIIFRELAIKDIPPANKSLYDNSGAPGGTWVPPANLQIDNANFEDIFKGAIYGVEMLADKIINFRMDLARLISIKNLTSDLQSYKIKNFLDNSFFKELEQKVKKFNYIQEKNMNILKYLTKLVSSKEHQEKISDNVEELVTKVTNSIASIVKDASNIINMKSINSFVTEDLGSKILSLMIQYGETDLIGIARTLTPLYSKIIDKEYSDIEAQVKAGGAVGAVGALNYYKQVKFVEVEHTLKYLRNIIDVKDGPRKIQKFVDTIKDLDGHTKTIGKNLSQDSQNLSNLDNHIERIVLSIKDVQDILRTQYMYVEQILEKIEEIPERQWKQPVIAQAKGGIDRGRYQHKDKSKNGSAVRMMSMNLTRNIFGGAEAAPHKPIKTNLADPKVYDFYKNVVTKDVGFYSRFFNLVRKDEFGNEVEIPDLKHALNVQEQERLKYRLNIIKLIGWKILQGIQRGGVTGIIGDIALIQYIPAYNPNLDIGNIWIDNVRSISRSYLSSNPEALANIARSIYYGSDYTVTVPTDPTPIKINMLPITKFISTFGTHYDMSAILKKLLASPLDGPRITSSWLEHEIKLQEHLLRSRSEWIREGDTFVRVDKQGNRIEEILEDNCAFIKNSVQECIQFLTSCALARDGSKNIPNECKDFVNFDFEINPPIQTLINKIVKINPKVAFGILKKFGFGSYLSEVKYGPTRKLRLFKVQSVGSWLREMEKECSPSCSQRSISLRKYLGDDFADLILNMARDPSKRAFFDYLDILVEWVNANPQVLNKEITKDQYPGLETSYPRTSERFNIYQYFNPYKPAEVRLRGIVCGLERLRTSILNGTSGINGTSVISNIAMTPSNIELPLSRTTVITPLTFTSPVLMTGGSIFSVQEELGNIKTLYGYKFFGQIYSDLENMMKGLTRSMRLSSETKKNIDEKLSKIKVLEEELWNNINSLIKWYEVFRVSQGNVDISGIPESDLPAILEKHSNLLQLSTAYNKRAINLIELFKTIAEAVLRKAEEKKSGEQITRPMTMNYP